MLETTTKVIDNYSITYFPLGAMGAMKLDAKVVRLVAPILKNASKFLPDESAVKVSSFMDADVSLLVDAFMSSLDSLSEKELESIVLLSLKGCTVVAPGKAPVQVQDVASIDAAFTGNLEVLYKAVYESWRYNNLTPFALLSRIGQRTQETSSSSTQDEATRPSGLRLAP